MKRPTDLPSETINLLGTEQITTAMNLVISMSRKIWAGAPPGGAKHHEVFLHRLVDGDVPPSQVYWP